MQLRWSQIDPTLARQVRAHQRTRGAVGTSADRETPRPLEPAWSAFSLLCASFIVAFYLNLCFRLTGPAALLALALCPITLLAALMAPTLLPDAVRIPLSPELLRDALAGVDLSRAQQVYGEMLLLLLDAPLARRSARDLLRQCNTLVADDARIAAHSRRLRALLNDDPLLHVEIERERLALRLAHESDAIARRSLEESLEIAAERREHLEALPTLLARLEAHRELICQTLSLAHAALLRERSLPLTVSPPDVAGLRQSVRQIAHQTRAIEEAASDLPALR